MYAKRHEDNEILNDKIIRVVESKEEIMMK